MDKILIMGAMEDMELDVLKENMQITNIFKENEYTFYEGMIHSTEVVLVHTRVGFINASAATTLAIQKYHPKAIISQGIAGGHGKQMHQKDMVVATDILDINSNYAPYLGEGEGINPKAYQLVDFDATQMDTLPIIQTDKKLVEACQKVDYSDGKVHFGRIGSGDIWNREIDKMELLANQYHTLCEEMEGYAIGKIAKNYHIPFVAIRAVSNNEALKEEYDRNCGKNAQEFVMKFLKNIE